MNSSSPFRYRAVKQLEEYQAIADAYTQLDTILEEGREKSQKNDYEDNLAIQNEIFKIYDFDFCEQRAEVMLA